MPCLVIPFFNFTILKWLGLVSTNINDVHEKIWGYIGRRRFIYSNEFAFHRLSMLLAVISKVSAALSVVKTRPQNKNFKIHYFWLWAFSILFELWLRAYVCEKVRILSLCLWLMMHLSYSISLRLIGRQAWLTSRSLVIETWALCCVPCCIYKSYDSCVSVSKLGSFIKVGYPYWHFLGSWNNLLI